VFLVPVVLSWSEKAPYAVLSLAVLFNRAKVPLAVLLLPSVLLKSASKPVAVFWLPVVRLERAPSPSAVLALG